MTDAGALRDMGPSELYDAGLEHLARAREQASRSAGPGGAEAAQVASAHASTALACFFARAELASAPGTRAAGAENRHVVSHEHAHAHENGPHRHRHEHPGSLAAHDHEHAGA